MGLIGHPEYDAGLTCLAVGALNSHGLNGIGSLAYAGGIDKAEQHAANGGGVLDAVTGGALDIAYQRTVIM